MDEKEIYCPFRTQSGPIFAPRCLGEKCALWHKRKNDNGTTVEKCGVLTIADALVHLATVGMDVYPS